MSDDLSRERDEALRALGKETAELERVRGKLARVVELLARFQAEGYESLSDMGEALELARSTLRPPPVDPYTRIPLEFGFAMGFLMSCAAQLRAIDLMQASERVTKLAIAVHELARDVLPQVEEKGAS